MVNGKRAPKSAIWDAHLRQSDAEMKTRELNRQRYFVLMASTKPGRYYKYHRNWRKDSIIDLLWFITNFFPLEDWTKDSGTYISDKQRRHRDKILRAGNHHEKEYRYSEQAGDKWIYSTNGQRRSDFGRND